MTASADKAAPVPISLEDLEYALSLLETEETSRPAWRMLIRQVIVYMAFIIFIATCPLGIGVIWFDRAVGIGSLIIAAICATVFFIITFSEGGVSPEDEIFAQLKKANIGDVAKQSYDTRSEGFFTLYGILLIPAAIAGLVGIIWLIFDLVVAGHVSAIPLILIAFPVFVLGIFTGIMTFREYVFYRQVSQVAQRFQQIVKNAKEEKDAQVSLSVEDMALLSQVETKNIRRSIAQVESNIQRFFAVAISPKASEFLKELKEKRLDDYYRLRDAIDELQENPRPGVAFALPDQPNVYQLSVSNYQINYTIDNERQRIEVTGIAYGGKGKM